MAANLEPFKATIQYAVIGLRSLFLINGGAILAMITFAGAKTIDEKDAEVLSKGLMLYSIGLVSVVLATGISYVAQSYYSRTFSNESTEFRTATRLRYVSVFFLQL